jgi:hypothetical protein
VTDTERFAAAWRDLRRRTIVYAIVMLSILPLTFVLEITPYSQLPEIHLLSYAQVPARLFAFFAIAVWLVGYFSASMWLTQFRCPRCGERFYEGWVAYHKCAYERLRKLRDARKRSDCRHCGLQNGAKPPIA